jgi:hypothetical protein
VYADGLADRLGAAAHGSVGLHEIETSLATMDVNQRVAWLAVSLLTPPLTHDVADRRAGGGVEEFHVLQGDIVRTESAYNLGVRIEAPASYMVATSSCDLIAGRRSVAMLLPVVAKHRTDFGSDRDFGGQLAALTLYKPRKHFYLPVLPNDPDDVVFNVALLDPLHVISNDQVNLVERTASLSLVGWRIFGVLIRELLVREAESEDRMRMVGDGTGAVG